MFKVGFSRRFTTNNIDETKFIDAVMHFSFLLQYETLEYNKDDGTLVLLGGSVMSLNPNHIRHKIIINYGELHEHKVTVKINSISLPWEKTKLRQLLMYRLRQLMKHLASENIFPADTLTKKEEMATIIPEPFTHLRGDAPFFYIQNFFKVLLSMFCGILGAVFIVMIYGFVHIGVIDGRLFLEVAYVSVGSLEIAAAASILGMSVGTVVGMLLSIYLALSEVVEYLNRRILSIGIFYALVLCFFMIEEEAFIISSILSFSIPFVAYLFYHMSWGLRSIFLRGFQK